jgi:Uma2 family endonuclease
MATTLARMTADEFERLPETDRKRELNNGVLVEVEMALAQHELVKSRLTMLLAHALFDSDFMVAPEAENRLGDYIARFPDLGLWREQDLESMNPDRAIVGGPLIAIEIVSSESAADLNEKILQYFAAGTKAVWVIYPRTRIVEIERPDGITRLDAHGVLQSPELVPDLNIKVSDVFSTLDKASAIHRTPRI